MMGVESFRSGVRQKQRVKSFHGALILLLVLFISTESVAASIDKQSSESSEDPSVSCTNHEDNEECQEENAGWLLHHNNKHENDTPRILYLHVSKTGGMSFLNTIPNHRQSMVLNCLIEQQKAKQEGQSAHPQESFWEAAWKECHKEFIDKFPPVHLRIQRIHQQKGLIPKISTDEEEEAALPKGLADRVLITEHMDWGVISEEHFELALPGSKRPFGGAEVETHDHDSLINTFLISMRHPISRIVSAFNYHRNSFDEHSTRRDKSQYRREVEAYYNTKTQQDERSQGTEHNIFGTCFHTIEDMAKTLLQPPQLPSTEHSKEEDEADRVAIDCRQLALHVLRGFHSDRGTDDTPPEFAPFGHQPLSQHLVHFYYNYQYYKQFSVDRYPKLPLYAVRTHHLKQDMETLDWALGGGAANSTASGSRSKKLAEVVVTHKSETYKVQSGLEQAEHRQIMCCALHWSELEAYQALLLSAVNLGDKDKRDTLRAAFDECGVEYQEDPVWRPFTWGVWYEQVCEPLLSPVV